MSVVMGAGNVGLSPPTNPVHTITQFKVPAVKVLLTSWKLTH